MSRDEAFEAIDRDLAELDELSPTDQVPVYERLEAALTSILDESRDPGSPAPGRRD